MELGLPENGEQNSQVVFAADKEFKAARWRDLTALNRVQMPLQIRNL